MGGSESRCLAQRKGSPLTACLLPRVAEELLARNTAQNHRGKQKTFFFFWSLLFYLSSLGAFCYNIRHHCFNIKYVISNIWVTPLAPPRMHLIYPVALHPSTIWSPLPSPREEGVHFQKQWVKQIYCTLTLHSLPFLGKAILIEELSQTLGQEDTPLVAEAVHRVTSFSWALSQR